MSRKIGFLGTPLFAVPVLKSLYQNGYPISAVFTQPEKKSKRGMGFNRTPVQSLSEIYKVKIEKIEDIITYRNAFGNRLKIILKYIIKSNANQK